MTENQKPSVTFASHSESETARLAAALAQVIPPNTTVGLEGTLGAGKTRLVQALAEACGVRAGTVVSPTFVLMQQYQGDRRLYHLDAYRVADEDEFQELGVEELFESDAITLIEWSDRVENVLPSDRLAINIRVCGETFREFNIASVGVRYDPVVAELSALLTQPK